MSFLKNLLSQRYNYMFYLGLLVPPCTLTEGPRSTQPVALFTLNYRVFCPFVGDVVPRPRPSSLVPDRRPSSRTVVPHPGLSSLVPDCCPSSWAVVPRPGPSSLVLDRRPSSFDSFWHIYSRVHLAALDS